MSREPVCTLLAHAKLNLSLCVLAREDSGYHQIETLFCALELADEVEVSAVGDVVSLDVVAPPEAPGAPPDLGPLEHNLAVRAAGLFRERTGIATGAHIRLVKRIPAGAGLGGGSSDAAAVLRALNRLHGEPLAAPELLALGARLGSDVPFFLTGAALALGWGRGERLLPLPPLPSAPVLLCVPEHGVATAEAYAALARRRAAGDPSAAPPAAVALPRTWDDVAAGAHNDFEAVIFERLTELPALRRRLEQLGARAARMTGSGSVVFGVFADEATAAATATRVAEETGVRTILTRTLEAV